MLQSSAYCTAGQRAQETTCWGKENNFIRKTCLPRRWQTNISINHFVRVWMPGYFIEPERERERVKNNEEMKSKGRTERERQWRNKVKTVLSVHVKSHQLCLTCYSMDGSSPSASVHGILQARIPEWVPISFFKGIEPASLKSYALPGVFFTTSTTWEAPHKGS